ncbi:MAG: MFS transporter [Actinobacteria bacterium]|nr:MAG: MFS transporter [Actinomycetota bacterium]
MYCSRRMTTTSSHSAVSWDRSVWGLLAVLCGVLFLDGLDVSMVGMALPSIESDLGLTTSQLQWIVSGYVLGYGGFLLLGGRAADLLGRRRVLLLALGAFTVASALGGVVSDGTLLVVTRFLKGASAAFTAPAGLSIITTHFAEGPERNRALGIYTATGASGFSFGLVFGGLLTELGWRWTFLLPVPIALSLLLAAPRLLPADRAAPLARRRFDLPGAATLTAGMLLLVHTIVEAPERGWGSAQTVVAFVISAALLAGFVAVERRSQAPLVRLGILRSGSLVRANLGAMALFGAYIGFQFVMTLYLQAMNGWSALETALAFLPAGLLVAFGSTRIGPLVDRLGTAPVVAAGAFASVAGYALVLRFDAVPDYAAVLLPTVVLLGLGFMLGFPTLNMQATNGIADHEQGLASGLVQTSFQVGGAISLAVVTAIVTAQAGGSTDPSVLLDAYRSALAVTVGIAAVGLVVALTGTARQLRAVFAGAEG